MKIAGLFTLVILIQIISRGQQPDTLDNLYKNTADQLLIQDQNLLIGGYGEVHLNQPLSSEKRANGMLDVHRVVMLFGYNFNKRTQFITELEFEHVSEVYVEQAFLQYKLNPYFNLRGGLLLIPMGIINEYHEPTAFNGVERPMIDTYIVPTTWREIGIGFSGNYLPAFLKYQFYILNGFSSYDGEARLSGSNGLRKGRQKGAESFISSPNFSAKLEYYGIRSFNFGLSAYVGKTQSTLYDDIEKQDNHALAIADSSVVGVSMLGADVRYNYKALMVRGQFYLSGLSNTEQYNVYTANNDSTYNDLGSSMIGYYFELAYDVLKNTNTKIQLIPFARYEYINTHSSVSNEIAKNDAYEKNIITSGLTLKLANGAVVKSDIQFIKSAMDANYSMMFNAGFGVSF
ncbi:MAG TPA: hypothetical protein PK904_04265 [Bacteroidales bacterium]|nr:hypothetical protein [Bacteroidales bacterium]